MHDRTVLISGAGVAGSALAYWLGRRGFAPTVVEIAPGLRRGGYAVDFRGPVHLGILDRMGILGELRRLDTGGSPCRFLDADGADTGARLPASFTGGEVEVARADLCRVLYEHSRDTTEYLFGDSITRLSPTEDGRGVRVTFAGGAERDVGLVIGADGMHSTVRRLAFGPESRHLTHLGHHIAGWRAPNDFGAGPDTLVHTTPGRSMLVSGSRDDPSIVDVLAVFASGPVDVDRRDLDRQRELITDAFAGSRWHVPRLLTALRDSPDLYFDAIARIDVPTWSTGRIVLAGDAAHGATLGGMGTGAAVVGAYVLAGELAAAMEGGVAGPATAAADAAGATGDGSGGNEEEAHTTAFARYEGFMRAYVAEGQKGGRRTAEFLAPPSVMRIRLRNRILKSRFVTGLMMKAGAKVAGAGVALPEYREYGEVMGRG